MKIKWISFSYYINLNFSTISKHAMCLSHLAVSVFLFKDKGFRQLGLLPSPEIEVFALYLSLVCPKICFCVVGRNYCEKVLFLHSVCYYYSAAFFLVLDSAPHSVDLDGLIVKIILFFFLNSFDVLLFLYLLLDPLFLDLGLVLLSSIEWLIFTFEKCAARKVESLLVVGMLPMKCLLGTFH